MQIRARMSMSAKGYVTTPGWFSQHGLRPAVEVEYRLVIPAHAADRRRAR